MNKAIYIRSVAICCDDVQRVQSFGLEAHLSDKLLLPKNLRRRTALTTRMAVTAAFKACEAAAVDSKALASVFASVGGEIQVTDALCRVLPDGDALLSPTQFHNSVHNTTAGYWSIINQCVEPSTAIAAAEDTFAMGLLEAWSQLQQISGCVLLVCYDEIWPQYLQPPLGKASFASAWVLVAKRVTPLDQKITVPCFEKCSNPFDAKLYDYMQKAPAAAAIPLLQALRNKDHRGKVALSKGEKCWQTFLY